VSATVFYNSAAELATCSNTFRDSGTPADPTAVTLVITDPAGVQVTYSWPGGPNTLTRTDVGTFTQDVPCSSAVDGIWAGLWTGTGTASDAAAFTWTVQSTSLNKYYCSAEELKSRLRLTSDTDDSEVALAVAAASRAVDGYCERYFYRAAETRTYVPRSLYETRVDDLVSVTALATDPAGTAAQGSTFPVSWAASDFQLLPYNPGKLGEPWPYTKIRAVGSRTFPWVTPLLLMRADRVQVTGVFGWPAVPATVKTAALIAASQILKIRDAPFGVAGFGEFGAVRVQSNPQVMWLLRRYITGSRVGV
jgi:hypothetical protein